MPDGAQGSPIREGSTAVPVAVIIPAFRASNTIGRALASVRRQSALPCEVWIVDDCSPDGELTGSVVELEAKSWPPGSSIRYLRLSKNVGPGEARNAAWAETRQPWVAFLDADDAWHCEKIRLQYTFHLHHPEAELSCHSDEINFDLDTPIRDEVVTPRRINRSAMLLANRVSTRTAFLRRDIPERFPPGKRYSDDYELFLRVALRGSPVFHLQAVLAANYRPPSSKGGLSGRLLSMELGELHTYLQMSRGGLLSPLLLLPLWSVSILKFFRRAFQVTFGG